MRVLVSGSSGLIGSAVLRTLEAGGHEVVRLVRSDPPPGQAAIRWDSRAERLEPASLEGFDGVVHLAGESLAKTPWTARRKRQILDSRVMGTRLLARTVARLARPPKVLASASAIGFYGNRGEEELDETASPGSGFLADVCRQWEAAAKPAADAGVRVVLLRTGLVLSTAGGGLAKMLPLFRWGLGGRLGSGRQYVSWISLQDVAAAIGHGLAAQSLGGPVNLTAPHPVTNAEFTRALARALHRPACFPAPAWALRAALGQAADELLLASARVIPRRLLASGFAFRDAELPAALERVIRERW